MNEQPYRPTDEEIAESTQRIRSAISCFLFGVDITPALDEMRRRRWGHGGFDGLLSEREAKQGARP